MSTFAVKLVSISDVSAHPGADRLDLVRLQGMDWQVVTQKDKYKVGDITLYFPIDSLLSEEIEAKIFPPDSKVKLSNHRVRTVKLRGAISQGMVVSPSLFGLENKKVGFDATSVLGVTKYEPPVKFQGANTQAAPKRHVHPAFKKYTGIENAKNYNSVFTEIDEIVITEKLHGSNFRAGYLPYNANSLLKKIKKLLRLSPQYEFVYGSHNVQLQDKLLYKGYYETNIYSEMVLKYDLKNKLKPGEVVYGEIIGDGVQKGYTYGCKQGERKLVCFEARQNDAWLDPIAAKKFIEERQLEFVPVLYTGPFNKEKILRLREGPSVYAPSQKVREGIVVRSIKEESCYIGRKMLKFISDEYLLKNQDEESIAH